MTIQNRSLLSGFIAAAAAAALVFPSATPAQAITLKKWFWPATEHSWYQDLTWRESGGTGYLCENGESCYDIYMINPDRVPNGGSAGNYVSYRIPQPYQSDIGIAWDSAHNCWWGTIPWNDHRGFKLPAAGSRSVEFTWTCHRNPCGITYDAIGRVILVASNVKTYIQKWTYNGTGIPQNAGIIDVGFPQWSLTRARNRYWVSRHVDGGPYDLLELDLNGAWTGRKIVLPEGREPHGLAFDGRYLWVKSNAPSKTVRAKIYQYDIGIAPTPAPTPASPVIDSGDYDGDGTSDIAVFRPSTRLWAVRKVTRFYFGKSGDTPASGDYRGDGTTAAAVFRPSRGLWLIRGLTRFYFGARNDIPVPGDYNGDGLCDPGIFRAAKRLWAIRGVTRSYFGAPADLPVPGYYSGSRRKDLAVYRPGSSLWLIRGVTRLYFGRAGDQPVPGSYTVSRRDEIAVYRPGTGLWAVRGVTRVYLGLPNSRPQPGDYQGMNAEQPAVFRSRNGEWRVRGLTRAYFGKLGDIPVSAPPSRTGLWRASVLDSGDYNGDGTSEIAVFRDSNGLWAIQGPTAERRIYFGQKGDIPVSGDYDGDGAAQIAIYRPATGLWSIRGGRRFYFGGGAGDIPLPGDYNGDGTCDAMIFDTASGRWKARVESRSTATEAAARLFGQDALVTSSSEAIPEPEGQRFRTLTSTYEFNFGQRGDIPLPGYYTRRTQKNIAIYRPSAGLWVVRSLTRFYFGKPGDSPITGDFNGDGKAETGIFRRDDLLWALRGLTRFYFGRDSNSIPVPADYRGDGTTDAGLFRTSLGKWEIRALTQRYFGSPGDIPIAGGCRQGSNR